MNYNRSLGKDCSWHLLSHCQAGGKVQPRSPARPGPILITSVEGGNISSVCFVALIELSRSTSLPERVIVKFQGSWPRNLYSTIKYWSNFTAPNTQIHQVRNDMCRFMNLCGGGNCFNLTKLHRISFTSCDQLFISICHLCT